MPYDPDGMSPLARAIGFTLWFYRTEDTLSAVYSDGYFDPAASMVKMGDMIIVNAMLKGRLQPANPTVVRVENGKVVIGF